jgi:glutamate dehydrogenase
MHHGKDTGKLTKADIDKLIVAQKDLFLEHYHWLETNLPDYFFQELSQQELLLIIHHLSHFPHNNFYSHIQFSNSSIVLSLDSKEADIEVLERFLDRGIKNYRSYLSSHPLPFQGLGKKLKISLLHFTEYEPSFTPLDENQIRALYHLLKHEHETLDFSEFSKLVQRINPLFLSSLSSSELKIATHLYLRAQTRDHCQYHLDKQTVIDTRTVPACPTHLIAAWKNTPKASFVYKIAKAIYRHGLSMHYVNITYITHKETSPILLMSLGLAEAERSQPSSKPDMEDFLKEFVTLKYFKGLDTIENMLVDKRFISGNQGNLLRCLVNMLHQTLLHADLNLYSHENVEEAFCRHPELSHLFMELFNAKFHPHTHNMDKYRDLKEQLITTITKLDTGHELYDRRRKEIFRQALNLIGYCLKTNYYRNNKSAFSFRFDPKYLVNLPFDYKEKFPEIPYGIFFIQGMHFMSFHVRFKDIARGGLRTVIPKKAEQYLIERNNIFLEGYNLAYTQQKKNKDIPEGGSKAIILLEALESFDLEKKICLQELSLTSLSESEKTHKVEAYQKQRSQELVFGAQRAFVHSLITLTNYSEDHILRAKDIVDYYKRPEYIYLGPDENMSNFMLEWIADYSVTCHYPLGKAFISSKPSCGINHKEYGVTSLGVNVYMEEVLSFLEIDPKEQPFTVKMTGGPDGDVAGNQILNLYHFYPQTAKLLTLIDGSGLIYDPEGLDLETLYHLFREGKPIGFYPPEKLHTGGFLLATAKKKEEGPYSQKTLLYEKKDKKIHETWLSSSEMNHLLRHHVHQTPTDVFIPAGGRPRTLNASNFKDFLDTQEKPTAKAIVEGANLYLTQEARYELEKRGVLIIKDSSANKGGVICSSLEVLTALTMPEKDFIQYKSVLMPQILDHIKQKAKDEAKLMLKTFAETGEPLTKISEMISEKINGFTYQLLDYLEDKTLSKDPSNPLMRCLLAYCLPYLQQNYQQSILTLIPDMHQKAMISCFIAAKLVYTKGLNWAPSIIDILPLIAQEIPLE